MTVHTGFTREPAPGVFVLERYDDSGWGWNVVAVRNASGGLLLYSPSSLGEDTFARIDALGGEVQALLVPNHFHNLALKRFRERYPKAKALASRGGWKRLARNGHDGLGPSEDALPFLPPDSRVLESEGMKTGEVWLSLPSTSGRVLLVGDSFMNRMRPTKGVTGFVVETVLGIGVGLSLSRTLHFLHIADKARYQDWARATVTREGPTTLVVTHGEPLTASDLTARLLALI